MLQIIFFYSLFGFIDSQNENVQEGNFAMMQFVSFLGFGKIKNCLWNSRIALVQSSFVRIQKIDNYQWFHNVQKFLLKIVPMSQVRFATNYTVTDTLIEFNYWRHLSVGKLIKKGDFQFKLRIPSYYTK